MKISGGYLPWFGASGAEDPPSSHLTAFPPDTAPRTPPAARTRTTPSWGTAIPIRHAGNLDPRRRIAANHGKSGVKGCAEWECAVGSSLFFTSVAKIAARRDRPRVVSVIQSTGSAMVRLSISVGVSHAPREPARASGALSRSTVTGGLGSSRAPKMISSLSVAREAARRNRRRPPPKESGRELRG